MSEPKKRGRRKKIVSDQDNKVSTKSSITLKTNDFSLQRETTFKQKNIILHLKCSSNDIDQYLQSQNINSTEFVYNPSAPKEIEPYQYNDDYQSNYQLIDSIIDEQKKTAYSLDVQPLSSKCEVCARKKELETEGDEYNKIKDLKIQYYKNNIPDKKVDCFWCTYPYDNDAFYILQNSTHSDLLAHGSFCSPSCAVAYLFSNMNWDDSAKMESYQLMNYYYAENHSYEKSIKPAMSPYYFLEKYYGNLSIQEYRKLSSHSHVMICLQKPITRVLPEIQEENDNVLNEGKGNLGVYKVKKQSEKPPQQNRNEILKNQFLGITQ